MTRAAHFCLRPSMAALLLACAAAQAAAAELADDLIGTPTNYVTRADDTLLDVARSYDLGYVEIRLANPGVDPWLPGAGVSLTLPTQHVLPAAPRRGINEHGGVIVLMRSDAASARRALTAAIEMAAKTKRPLTVWLAADSIAVGEVHGWIEAANAGVSLHCRIERLRGGRDAVLRVAAGHADDLLVVDADRDITELDALRGLVTGTEANVLLVR